MLAEWGQDDETTIALMANTLSVDCEEVRTLSTMGEQEIRVKTRRALTTRIEQISQEKPLLLVFEDLHWADATSLELLDVLVDRAKELCVLIVLTFRSEFSPPWVGESHVLLLALSRLSRKQSATVVEYLAAEASAQEVERIVARTDGVPLFLEELTQAVKESASPVNDAIPKTLADSLTARLDRLNDDAKYAAQVGASIGREFPYRLIAQVSQITRDALDVALKELESAGLVLRRGQPPDAEYLFKHALVQDAAYAGLLRPRRKELNWRVVEALQQLYPERADAEPELLARHYAEAGDVEQSIICWQRALVRALARGASREAGNSATNGLQQVELLPENLDRDRLELEFQSALSAVLMMTAGWFAPTTMHTFERSRELSVRLNDSHRLAESLIGICNYYYGGQHQEGIKTADEMITLGRKTGEKAYEMVGHYLRSGTMVLGNFEEAREDLEIAVVLGETVSLPDTPYFRLNDSLACSLNLLAHTLFSAVVTCPGSNEREY